MKPLFLEVALQHAGKGRVGDAGQELRHEFKDCCLNSPEIGKRLGHLDADGAASNDNGLADSPFCQIILYGNGLVKIAYGKDTVQVGSGDGNHVGAAPGCNNQLIVRDIVLFACIDIFDQDGPGLSVDRNGPRSGADRHALGILEKRHIPGCMKAGGAEFFFIRDITGDIIGDPAPAI